MALETRFTPSEVIDAIEPDDKMVDLIGYVDEMEKKHLASNNAYVSKIVINNGLGKRVQIVAWAKFIGKLESVSDLQNVIHIEGAHSKYVSSNARYNSGNVNFQLEVKEHTILKRLGTYTAPTIAPAVTSVTFENLATANGLIEIDGAVKNAFRLLSTKFQRYGLGSITNGKYKLEVRIPNFRPGELDHIHKGHVIKLKGELICKNQQIYLNIRSSDSIKIIEKEKKPLAFLLQATDYLQ